MKTKTNLIIILIEIAIIGLVGVIFYNTSNLHRLLAEETVNAKKMLITADELRQTSDDLTHFARTYVVTEDQEFKERYYTTLNIRNGKAPRPEGYSEIYWDLAKEVRARKHPLGEKKSLDDIIDELPFTLEETAKLQEAHHNSDDLVNLEVEAFNALEGVFKDAEGRYTIQGEPDQQLAIGLLHSKAYYEAKHKIMDPIDDFLTMLNMRIDGRLLDLNRKIDYYEQLLIGVIFGYIVFNFLIYRYLNRRHAINRKELESLVEQRTKKYLEAQKKLEEAQNLAHFGSWELDLVSDILTWSKEVYRIFEIEPDAVEPSYALFSSMIHPDDRAVVDKAYQDSVKHHTPYNIEHRLVVSDERVKYVMESGETYYDEKGVPIRSIGTILDITERKLLEIELQHSAQHDSLTGLYDRQVFEQRIGEEVSRAERYRHPLSVFMLDIDHFKKINDTYGHKVGDLALCKFSDILKESMRKTDVIARYGGEEFVILLPECSHDQAMELAERLRTLVAGEPYMTLEDKKLYLTVSIGVAVFPEHAGSPLELLEAADSAMYSAKTSGRNRVVSA